MGIHSQARPTIASLLVFIYFYIILYFYFFIYLYFDTFKFLYLYLFRFLYTYIFIRGCVACNVVLGGSIDGRSKSPKGAGAAS